VILDSSGQKSFLIKQFEVIYTQKLLVVHSEGGAAIHPAKASTNLPCQELRLSLIIFCTQFDSKSTLLF